MTITINEDFCELTHDDAILITGGWSWDDFADFVGGVAVVSAAIPGGGAVTIVCGCYYAGYKLGKAIAG